MPVFPFQPTNTNHWFKEPITRSSFSEPSFSSVTRSVDMINITEALSFLTAQVRIQDKLQTMQLSPGEKVVFHGTSAQSAASIVNGGITLFASLRRTDFSSGGGFYVTENKGKAIEWAQLKARKTCRIGAVVAFRVPAELLNEEPHLSLESDSSLWEKVVRYFRHGTNTDDVSSRVAGVKFITGPVARYYKRYPSMISQYGFTQMCINDADYAKRFGSLNNVCFVVFFDL